MAERSASLCGWFETYPQTVEIQFADEESAARVEPVLLPLRGGAEWAVTSRWDDNCTGATAVREKLLQHGFRGTFYLVGSDQPWYQPGGGDVAAPEGIHRRLADGGFSLGGHTWTHPMLTHCNQNRMFEEAARARCDLEAVADAPVTSFSLPFGRFADVARGPGLQRDLADAILRAGYQHVANSRFIEDLDADLPVSFMLPPDGEPIDATVERLLADSVAREANPCLSLGVHPWYRTPEAWAGFEATLARYARRPTWWYCNQSEYGAYRLQYRQTRMVAERLNRSVLLRLERPALLDLGDAVPLTIELRGVPAERITAILAHDAAADRLPDAHGTARFDLHHRAGQRLPETIGWIANDSGRTELTDADFDADFPGLRGLLSCQDMRLWVELRNDTDAPLEEVRITYRTPTAWHEGVIARGVDAVAPGETASQRLGLNAAKTDYRYHSAAAFFCAQVDFVHRGRPGRLHLTCRQDNPVFDRSYPQGAFERLGPVPRQAVTYADVPAIAASGSFTLPDGRKLTWLGETDEHRRLFDVESIVTSGRWEPAEEAVWLMRARLESEVEQTVETRLSETVRAVFLNGERVDPARLRLPAGPSTIVLVHRSRRPGWEPENAAVFLRLVEPATGWRVVNVTFAKLSSAG